MHEARFAVHAFSSIARVLRSAAGDAAWVLLLRWDAYFFNTLFVWAVTKLRGAFKMHCVERACACTCCRNSGETRVWTDPRGRLPHRFSFAALDRRRFYIAGSCAKRPWPATLAPMRCARGRGPAPDCVPDFWFAASPRAMRRVFVGDDAEPAAAAGTASATAAAAGAASAAASPAPYVGPNETCWHGHGLLHRRLRALVDARPRPLLLGRYKIHFTDFT